MENKMRKKEQCKSSFLELWYLTCCLCMTDFGGPTLTRGYVRPVLMQIVILQRNKTENNCFSYKWDGNINRIH